MNKKQSNKKENNTKPLDKKEENSKVIYAYIMAIVGFVMILINAVGYIFNLDIKSPALTVLGLVFVVIGMTTVRKREKFASQN